jgi:hypothetical protein
MLPNGIVGCRNRVDAVCRRALAECFLYDFATAMAYVGDTTSKGAAEIN